MQRTASSMGRHRHTWACRCSITTGQAACHAAPHLISPRATRHSSSIERRLQRRGELIGNSVEEPQSYATWYACLHKVRPNCCRHKRTRLHQTTAYRRSRVISSWMPVTYSTPSPCHQPHPLQTNPFSTHRRSRVMSSWMPASYSRSASSLERLGHPACSHLMYAQMPHSSWSTQTGG